MTHRDLRPTNKHWVMVAVSLGVLLSSLDGSITGVALPTLARALGASFAAVQWVVLAYLFTVVSLMMSAGRLADAYGKKTLYALGFVVFGLGSLVCAMAPSIGWLLLGRVVQGLGGALLMTLGVAIVAETFPATERGRAMGYVGFVVSIGIVSGPPLGGLIVSTLPWQTIFLLNLPLAAVGTSLVLKVVPRRPLPPPAPFDLLGAVLLPCALLGLLLAVTLKPSAHLPAPWLWLFAALSLTAGLGLLRVERAATKPLIDLPTLGRTDLHMNLMTNTVVFVASSGLVLLVPFFLQDLQGRPPAHVGLLMMVPPVLMGLVSPLAGRLSDRLGTRPLSTLGLFTLVVGYWLVSGLQLHTPAGEYVARVACLGLGMGLFLSPNNSAILSAVPRERLGMASGLLALTRTLGQALGAALVGTLWASLTRHFDAAAAVDATSAPLDVQRRALQWTARTMAVLLAGAALLALHAWRRRRSALGPGPLRTPPGTSPVHGLRSRPDAVADPVAAHLRSGVAGPS